MTVAPARTMRIVRAGPAWCEGTCEGKRCRNDPTQECEKDMDCGRGKEPLERDPVKAAPDLDCYLLRRQILIAITAPSGSRI